MSPTATMRRGALAAAAAAAATVALAVIRHRLCLVRKLDFSAGARQSPPLFACPF